MDASIAISLVALFVSGYSVWFNRTNRKEDFLRKLKSDIWEVEKIFADLSPKDNFNGLNRKDILQLEEIRFRLLYQHSEKEKERYLPTDAYKKLREIHEIIDDNYGMIISGTNPETHRDQTINELKKLLQML